MNKHKAAKFFSYILASLTVLAINTSNALAVGSIQDGVNAAKGYQQPTDLFGNAGIFTTISNVLLFIIGAIAVIMIIIGGLRYVLSGGDSSQVQSAKNTILYALVGVIIALLAYAIVNFVIGAFTPGANTTGVSGASVR